MSESKAVSSSIDDPLLMGSHMASVVKELHRHGYVTDPHLEGSGGAICRHPSAPTLLVLDDGRMELVGGKPANGGIEHLTPQRGVRWGRSIVFLAILGATAFLGLLVVAMVVG